MESRNLILVEDEGDLRGFVGSPREGLRKFVGRYRPIGRSPQLLVLRREAGTAIEDPEDRILMAGEILYQDTILEVLNMIVASRWTGALHVYGADSHRVLGLDKGSLRFAQSDDPEDRLNKVLFRLGVLSPSQSEEVERWPKSDQRFGEALLRKGLMGEKELFRYLERQMAEILHSAVLNREGCYLFAVGDQWTADASVTAHIPMQQLLFDAAERLDRFIEFEKLVPDEGLCPAVRSGVEVTRLGPKERRVLGVCDGSRSVREISRESWLGRYGAMEVIYDLVRRECVDLQDPKRDLEEVARDLVAPFAEALREITETVDRNGDIKQLHEELTRWVQGSEYEQYLGPALTERLSVDPCQIAAVLESLKIRDREEIVEHALHELVAFTLFAASLHLSRADERSLHKRVQERLG
ncbi:MAG: hypothetical protein PVG07_02255 [Acidobacteriota bacterium]